MSVIASLIEAYKPPAEDFEITLSKGEVLKFRRVSDYDEFCRIKREAGNFHKSLRGGAVLPEMKPFVPKEPEAAATVFLVALLSVEPKFEQLDVMVMGKKCPDLLNEIATKLDYVLSNSLVNDEEKEFLEAKNEFGQTSGGETL